MGPPEALGQANQKRARQPEQSAQASKLRLINSSIISLVPP